MKRFKLIFHAFYILVFLTLLYFSVDILMNTEQYLSKIKLSSYIKFPKYVTILFLIIAILMAVEYVMQQIRIHKLKGDIDDLEDEVVGLKAKLYDKAQEEEGEASEEGGDEEEEDPSNSDQG